VGVAFVPVGRGVRGMGFRPTTNQGEQMNIQEKLAAIEQHAAKCLIETRELMVYLTGHPAAAVSFDDIPAHTPNRIVKFPGRSRSSFRPEWISPLDERGDDSVWDDAS
jgi:hypothetical protein